jgi:hypothetical protein
MYRIASKKLAAAACLWLMLSGASAVSAQAANDIGAIVDPSDLFLIETISRECPTPAVPYGITPGCAHALSEQAIRTQALRDYERAAAAQAEAVISVAEPATPALASVRWPYLQP